MAPDNTMQGQSPAPAQEDANKQNTAITNKAESTAEATAQAQAMQHALQHSASRDLHMAAAILAHKGRGNNVFSSYPDPSEALQRTTSAERMASWQEWNAWGNQNVGRAPVQEESNISSPARTEPTDLVTPTTPATIATSATPTTLYEELATPLTQILGHWYYSAFEHGVKPEQTQPPLPHQEAEGAFLYDEVMAGILGLNDHHSWHDPISLTALISAFDTARIWLTVKHRVMGDVIFERITFIDGPFAGQNFLLQGSILARDENNHALYATGYISHESSPYSEFIPREISGDGMFIWNLPQDELICSASFQHMLGYSDDEFPHSFHEFNERLLHPDDNDTQLVQGQVLATNLYGDYYECCMRLKHKAGHYVWTISRGLVLSRDEHMVATQIIGTQTNINLVQSNFDHIKLMMFNDSLTGLHNRTYFQQNALRYDSPEQRPLSIIFVDVTGLKLTNDILGHSFGDYLIIKTCELMRQAIGEEIRDQLRAEPQKIAQLREELTQKQQQQRQNQQQPLQPPAPRSSALKLDAEPSVAAAYILDSTRANAASTASNDSAANAATESTLNSADHLSQVELAQLVQLQIEKSGVEIMRLAGDEFLLLYPQCPSVQAQALAMRLKHLRDQNNAFHEQHTSIEERPVPVCFGVGVATTGDERSPTGQVQSDSLKKIIDRADRRMQADKDQHREHDYRYLQQYFENKKGRPVSMRDDRRFTVLPEKERQIIRSHRISNIIF